MITFHYGHNHPVVAVLERALCRLQRSSRTAGGSHSFEEERRNFCRFTEVHSESHSESRPAARYYIIHEKISYYGAEADINARKRQRSRRRPKGAIIYVFVQKLQVSNRRRVCDVETYFGFCLRPVLVSEKTGAPILPMSCLLPCISAHTQL